MHKLIGHKSNSANSFECSASVKDTGDYVTICFEVENYYPNTKDSFGQNYKENKGLWDFDVCEVFLSFSGDRYLELQSSPLNQPFSYLVEKPRELFSFPESLDFNLYNSIEINHWSCEMKIAKKNIPGTGELIGNLFVCLGDSDDRYYFALNVNEEEIADFHRPDLFQSLIGVS